MRFCWGKVNVWPELLPFFTWIQRIVLISRLRTWKLVNLKNLQRKQKLLEIFSLYLKLLFMDSSNLLKLILISITNIHDY